MEGALLGTAEEVSRLILVDHLNLTNLGGYDILWKDHPLLTFGWVI
jgi:hypothetical protein